MSDTHRYVRRQPPSYEPLRHKDGIRAVPDWAVYAGTIIGLVVLLISQWG